MAAAEPTVETATTGQLTTTVDLTGTASAPLMDDVSFGVAGSIVSVEVAAGDTVEEGQVLATIDQRDLEQAVTEAHLSLQVAQSSLSELIASSSDPSAAAQVAQAQQTVAEAEVREADAQEALADLRSPDDAALVEAYATVAEATAALTDAEDALAALEEGPSDVEMAAADSKVASAQSALIAAADDVIDAQNKEGAAITWDLILKGEIQTTPAVITSFLLSQPTDPLVAGAATDAEEAAYLVAKANLQAALTERDELTEPADPSALALARSNAGVAQLALDDANEAYEAVLGAWNTRVSGGGQVPVTDAIEDAQAEVDAAQTAAVVARAQLDAALDGPDNSTVASGQLSVLRAETALEDAQEALESAILVAPFAGTVQSVAVAVGDTIDATTVVLTLLNEDEMDVELTVAESDLPSIAVGQTGVATFDAMGTTGYAVEITSINRVPSTAQGVVSYSATARITGLSLAVPTGAGGAGGAFGGGAFGGGTLPGGDGTGGFPGGAGAGGAGIDSEALRERLASVGITLPEDVDPAEALQAFLAGGELPEGVEVPDDFDPSSLFGGGALGGGQGGGQGGAAGAGDGTGVAPVLTMPAPGMSASVTITTEVRDEAVLVPTSAVRIIDGAYYVSVRGEDGLPARLEVTIGSSDGSQVEILSGLEEGDEILLGAETEGVPLSVSQASSSSSTQGAAQGQGFFAIPGGGGQGGAP